MKTKLSSALCVSVLLGGCVTSPHVDQESAAQIKNASKISHDDFRKITVVDAQKVAFTNIPWWDIGLDEGLFWLSASKSDSDSLVLLSLRFKTTRGHDWGWAFWEAAFDESGLQLPVEKIASEVGDGGITYELVAVGLTQQFLDAHSKTGIRLRIDGRRAKREISLPPNYVVAFLEKADAAFSSK